MISTPLVVAAVLTMAVGVVHSWLGEHRLIGPLLSPEGRRGILASSSFARQVLRFAWHLTPVAWWGFAAIMGALALSPPDGQARLVLVMIAVTFLTTGLTVLITSRGRHLAWPVFLAIAGLCMAPLL